MTYDEGLPKSNDSRDGVNQSKAAQQPSILAEKTHGFCCQLPGKFSHFLSIGILCMYIYIYLYVYNYILYIYIYTDANGTIAHKFPQHLHWPGISWLCWAAVAILLGLQSSESSWRTSVFRGELCFGLGLLPWNHVESMDSSLSMARNLNWRYLPYIRIKRPT